MATNTDNLVLRKPDGTDLVNVITDLNDNFEKIDDLYDVWTAYAAVWAGTGVVVGNAVMESRYRKRGKFLDFAIRLAFGSTSAAGTGDWTFSLPAGIAAVATGTPGISEQWGPASCFKAATGVFAGSWNIAAAGAVFKAYLPTSAANCSLTPAKVGTPVGAWAAGDFVFLSGTLQVA